MRPLLFMICMTVLMGCSKQPGTERERLERAAARKDSSAQFKLGVMYTEGNEVPRDDAKAIEWFNKSAALGNSDAQLKLGTIFEAGKLAPKDEKKAAEWYQKAAFQRNAAAQAALASLYEEGRGVPKDDLRAYAWFKLAAASLPKAIKRRDDIEKRLTGEQMSEARKLSTDFSARMLKN